MGNNGDVYSSWDSLSQESIRRIFSFKTKHEGIFKQFLLISSCVFIDFPHILLIFKVQSKGDLTISYLENALNSYKSNWSFIHTFVRLLNIIQLFLKFCSSDWKKLVLRQMNNIGSFDLGGSVHSQYIRIFKIIVKIYIYRF